MTEFDYPKKAARVLHLAASPSGACKVLSEV
jgi:hypothetical protein